MWSIGLALAVAACGDQPAASAGPAAVGSTSASNDTTVIVSAARSAAAGPPSGANSAAIQPPEPWPPLAAAPPRLAADGRPEVRAASAGGESISPDGKAEERFWSRAEPTTFDTDYAGVATGIVTRARFAWSPGALHAFFELVGAGLFTDTSRPVEAERDRLYEEDCVELFVTPDARDRARYFEIEVGPFGHYFDLDVRKGKQADASFASGVRIGTLRDAAARRAAIEVTIPSPELAKALAPGARLRVGIYRMEGEKPRRYLAWSPPRTDKPSFHEPDAFGTIELAP